LVAHGQKNNLTPKIVFMDLEGTIFRKEHRLDNGIVAPSAWTVIADYLGEDCLSEEEKTKQRWIHGGYCGYVEWMRDTIRIHQKYGLRRGVFEEVINAVEFMPGVREAVAEFREFGAITAIVSGGFKALADRAQRELKIDHALSACDYFFNNQTGEIDHFNLLPSDEEGKVDFVRLIAKEHGVLLNDCAFIGDGKNDVHLAHIVGCSVAFNAQPELKQVAHLVIEQPRGQEDFAVVTKAIREYFSKAECPH
jgi:phosphoserine phosphatase